ncbi:MAG TPA: VWA domain-containing protein [Acidimicrobiales bacterium]|nr:VWA domain-containing protein [Acidimicrobiales bacterium]
MTENVDAASALRHIPFEDREAFKYALGTTMVKNQAHWRAFETVFEVYFARTGASIGSDDQNAADASALEQARARARMAGMGELGEPNGSGSGEPMSPEDLAAMLYKAIMLGDEEWTRAIARISVSQFAGMEPGRPVGGVYYLYRTLRNLNLEALLASMVEEERERAPNGLTPLEQRLIHDELSARIDALRREIESEIRRRLVADRGPEALAKSLRKPLPEEIDFMHANREELGQLRKTVQPLSRKLAVRLARRRRHLRRGTLDFRSTIRHSLSYGGVPAEPRFRKPRPHKPEIVVLADISGSVASFARFTLHLVHALNSQFSKIRSFVFVDGVDEVTHLLEGAEDIGEAVHRVNTEADVVWVDGHSDYGHVFEAFYERWGNELTSKSSVIILGDARNNYHATNAWVLREMRKHVRNIYWLDPEPRAYWDTGDSVVGAYAIHCDGVFECRNLRQLEQFVDHLA